MKIIISHDIDHITAWEHWQDLIIPKHIARNLIEVCLGYVSIPELASRFGDLISNKWQNVEELMEFNTAQKVPATFFVAVNNGRNLRYSRSVAEFWVSEILRHGFDVGVHGLQFDNENGVKEEYDKFRELSKMGSFGARMHDIGPVTREVKLTIDHLDMLDRTGYVFSSNTFEWKAPFRIGALWEFPVNIMDGNIFCVDAGWQNRTPEQAKEETERLMAVACDKGLPYFTILFHDIYFSRSFRAWREWYCWVIDYCKRNNFEFVNYKEAVRELEG